MWCPTCFFDRIYSGLNQKIIVGGFLNRKVFEFAYKYKLNNMRKGLKHEKASPLFDQVVFSKIKQGLGEHVRVMSSRAAPLARHVEEFLRVVTCFHVVQDYGLTETFAGSFLFLPNVISMIETVGPPVLNIDVCFEIIPEMGYDALSEV